MLRTKIQITIDNKPKNPTFLITQKQTHFSKSFKRTTQIRKIISCHSIFSATKQTEESKRTAQSIYSTRNRVKQALSINANSSITKKGKEKKSSPNGFSTDMLWNCKRRDSWSIIRESELP